MLSTKYSLSIQKHKDVESKRREERRSRWQSRKMMPTSPSPMNASKIHLICGAGRGSQVEKIKSSSHFVLNPCVIALFLFYFILFYCRLTVSDRKLSISQISENQDRGLMMPAKTLVSLFKCPKKSHRRYRNAQ